MRGLAIIFTENGAQLDTAKFVRQHGLKVQNALVNLGTGIGTDRVHPSRGTELAKKALSSGFRDIVESQHELNFATSASLFFERANEPMTEKWSLAEIRAEPATLVGRFMTANMSFEHVDQTVTGTPLTPVVSLESF